MLRRLYRPPNCAPVPNLRRAENCCTRFHCRLREFQGRKEARSIAHWIEPTWLETLGIVSPLGPKDDLRVGDVEIADAEEEKVNQYEWAVYERHRAAIWLVGEEGPLYSHVTVDT